MPLSVVLVEPEIPWNTGNIGRTCVAAGAALHLVGRLGFSLSERRLKRSGLDYWPQLKLVRHEDFAAFERGLPPRASLLFFSGAAKKCFWDAPYRQNSYLVFGKESGGLPEALLSRHQDRLYRIPMEAQARSLNLSTAAGIALYAALRSLQ
ncbi:MAG: tRNA (cytidine(34)-2'-O)-methyltransferase [Elusimicrobia bacterium]|nr:tRNA (cytidine(34)-2'-O)-methyltransferase [Elusimicrobiota bacterium]